MLCMVGQEILTPELIGAVITVCVIPMLGIITKYVITYIQSKTAEIEHKMNNETMEKYLKIAEDAVCTAVTAVNQTLVEVLKENGKFDKEAQQEAFTKAKEQALAIMGSAAQETVNQAYGDINVWLNNKIEYYVNKSKS